MAQVTRQNPVEGLEQADSKISLSVEHRAVFCSSSVICLQLGLSLLKRMFFKRKAWTGAMTAHGPPSNCSSAVCSFSQKTNPWVHLRKIEADTPPLEGLPQTRSTTSLFNSDMTNFFTAGESTGTPSSVPTAKRGKEKSVEANLQALSEDDSPLLSAGRACGIGHKLPVLHDTVFP